jgi:hypothetical protein
MPGSDVLTRRFEASQSSKSLVSYATRRAEILRNCGPKPVMRNLLSVDSASPVYVAAAPTEIRVPESLGVAGSCVGRIGNEELLVANHQNADSS